MIGHTIGASQGLIARCASVAARCRRGANASRHWLAYSAPTRSSVSADAFERPDAISPAHRSHADCIAMLMPSPMIGCASAAALPIMKRPSARLHGARMPGWIGPMPSHAPSRRAPARTSRSAAVLARKQRSNASPADCPGATARQALRASRRMHPASVSSPFSAMTRPPYPPANEMTGRTPGASRERLKVALKANRSLGLLTPRRLSPGLASHEPFAMIKTGARRSVRSGAARDPIPH